MVRSKPPQVLWDVDGPGYEDMTKEEARAAGIEGRSNMGKSELIHALRRH